MGDISNRAKALGPKAPSYFKLLKSIWTENPGSLYDPQTNPDGILILTIAENNLTLDLLKSKLNAPAADGSELPDVQYNYGNNAYFLKDLSEFFKYTFFAGRNLSPSNLIVGNGAGSVLNMLSYTLCDPGDHVIIPSPYYPGFDLDLEALSGVVPLPAHMVSSNQFALDVSKLQETYDQATKSGKTVKALLLCSPNNPAGTVYDKEKLIEVLMWARARKLHLIVDEIYALSCFDPSRPFVSIASVLTDLNENFGDDVHVVWSFSKDFSLSGFRVGVCYSENKAVIEGMNNQGFFYMSSNHTQFLLHKLVTDSAFVSNFVTTNQRNLMASYHSVTQCLAQFQIPFVPGGAGFFILIDLREYLSAAGSWDAEMALFQFLALECKVVFTPGVSMHCHEPGWFRCCFASYAPEVVVTGLTRMAQMLKSKRAN